MTVSHASSEALTLASAHPASGPALSFGRCSAASSVPFPLPGLDRSVQPVLEVRTILSEVLDGLVQQGLSLVLAQRSAAVGNAVQHRCLTLDIASGQGDKI